MTQVGVRIRNVSNRLAFFAGKQMYRTHMGKSLFLGGAEVGAWAGKKIFPDYQEGIVRSRLQELSSLPANRLIRAEDLLHPDEDFFNRGMLKAVAFTAGLSLFPPLSALAVALPVLGHLVLREVVFNKDNSNLRQGVENKMQLKPSKFSFHLLQGQHKASSFRYYAALIAFSVMLPLMFHFLIDESIDPGIRIGFGLFLGGGYVNLVEVLTNGYATNYFTRLDNARFLLGDEPFAKGINLPDIAVVGGILTAALRIFF